MRYCRVGEGVKGGGSLAGQQLLMPNPRDRSRERRWDNWPDPFRRRMKMKVGMKQKNASREQTGVLLVINL